MGILQQARRFFNGPDRQASRERRKLKRIACHQSFIGTRDGVSFPLTVVDVGFGGFKVISDREPGPKGALVHLRRVANDFQRHLTPAYTTGVMVKVAWVRPHPEGGFEAGLYLPQAPGSMRISWFKELLAELGMDEKSVFSQRHSRRHRCRLPAGIAYGQVPSQEGLMLDLSSGGGLFGAAKAAPMGEWVQLSVTWGRHRVDLKAEVVGVRQNLLDEGGGKWLHSLKFQEELPKKVERILLSWLEELARNE